MEQKNLLQIAVKMLEDLGVKFLVIDEKGNRYGEVRWNIKNEINISKARVKYGSLSGVYKDSLQKLEVGKMVKIETPEGVYVEKMRESMRIYAMKMLGKGNFKTSVIDGHVYVFRLK